MSKRKLTGVYPSELPKAAYWGGMPLPCALPKEVWWPKPNHHIGENALERP